MVKRHRALHWSMALALAAVAHAAEPPASPACALLSENEAIVIVNGAPVIGDGGAAQNGYSDCAWSNTGGGAVLSLLYWSADAFTPDQTAEQRYEKIAAALKLRHLPVTNLPGLGEHALLLDEGSPGLAAYTVIVLDHGAVAQLADRGVTRSATLDAAKAIAGRMTGEVTPPAPAGDSACALVAASDLPRPGFVMQDGGPPANGETTCNWQSAQDNIDISLILRVHKPSADPNSTDVDYYTELPPAEEGHARDPLTDVGEKADIEADGDDPNASYTVTLMARGKLAVLSTFRVERAAAIALATAIGKRL
jgi:hypothetical protein